MKNIGVGLGGRVVMAADAGAQTFTTIDVPNAKAAWATGINNNDQTDITAPRATEMSRAF